MILRYFINLKDGIKIDTPDGNGWRGEIKTKMKYVEVDWN
jgi:hypothetical protein